MNVGIVGLGLIGGSLAKSTKRRTEHTVWGIARSRETMTMARMCGAIDGALNDETIPQCGLLLVALRPQIAIDWVKTHAPLIAKSAIVVDMCGVKRVVVEALKPLAAEYGFSYVGGHPMAGKERWGFTASSDDLFVGASMILTPDENTNVTTLETLKSFFLDLGFANLTLSTPEEHDRIISYTSQLAHIASSSYVKSPEALRRRGFSAGSFHDMTRVARLDEDMWTELFLDNADFLTGEVEIYIQHLEEYRNALRDRNAEQLRALLKDGRERKAAAGGI